MAPFGDSATPTSKTLDCHMEWLSEFIPGYLTGPEKDTYFERTHKAVQEHMEDDDNKVKPPWKFLSLELTTAALYAHQGNFSTAMEWIERAVDSLKTLSVDDMGLDHFLAYEYLVKANFYKISRRMQLVDGVSITALDEKTSKYLKELVTMYKNSPQFIAAIYHFRGRFAHSMANSERAIEMLRLAVRTEPTYAFFKRDLYCALRKKRREARITIPSKEEEQAIKDAHELSPDDCLINSKYASMLEEKLKVRRYRDLYLPGTREELVSEIIELMTSCIAENPTDKWTAVRLAEIYGYGHFPHLDTRVGRQMFEDLEARWPKSSMVLHKFGLYYALTEKNYIKAFQYYSRSLEADQDNFPCLMDYLKMCQRLEIGWAPMLAMVDKTLTVVRRTPIMVKLMAMKGLLHWLINQDGVGKQQACNVWIAAVEKTPTAVSTIGTFITDGCTDPIRFPRIDVHDVVCQLKVIFSYDDDSDHRHAASKIIDELEQGRGRHGTSNYSSARSIVSTSSYATAKTTVSVADSVDNWRAAPKTGLFAAFKDPMEIKVKERIRRGLDIIDEDPVLAPSRTRSRTRTLSAADMSDNWRR